MSRTVVVAGVGMVPFAKPGASEEYNVMATKAGEAALADAGDRVTPRSQQAYAGYVYGDSTCGQRAVYEVGLTGIPVFNVNNNCSTGSTALLLARAGGRGRPRRVRARRRLRADGERRARRSGPDRANPLDKFAATLMNEVQGFNQAPPAAQMFGGAGREYRWKYGTKRETFAKISREGAQARGEEPVRAVHAGAAHGRGDPGVARGASIR